MTARLIAMPIEVPPTPSSSPSVRNSDMIRRGGVPMAAMVPISRMRSYTAIIMTFITLIRTMETSITLMNTESRSIIRTMLENGDRSAHVWTSRTGRPSLLVMPPSAPLSRALT